MRLFGVSTRTNVIFLGIIFAHLGFLAYIHWFIPSINFNNKNIFFLDLIGTPIHPANWLIYFFEVGNLIILWLISKKFFTSYLSFIVPSIYAISPWNSYLVVAGSFYIILLFTILLLIYGLLLIHTEKKFLGLMLVVCTTTAGIYSSFFLLFLLFLFFILLIFFKMVSLKTLILPLIILFFSVLPLLFLIVTHQVGYRNIFQNEVKIFADPGLQNSINSYRGEAKKEHYAILAKIADNKYELFSEYLVLKFIRQIVPATYFTFQEKLINFSFSPPIFLGLLIPFFYGLYITLNKTLLRKILCLSLLFVIPSMMASQKVDLNRLILFYPTIIFIIAFGVAEFVKNKKDKNAKAFLVLTFSLVIFQMLLTIYDITYHENDRFLKISGNNYIMQEQ